MGRIGKKNLRENEISAICPNCATAYAVHQSKIGTTMLCEKCGNEFMIEAMYLDDHSSDILFTAFCSYCLAPNRFTRQQFEQMEIQGENLHCWRCRKPIVFTDNEEIIIRQCNECGQTLILDEQLSGMRVKCPNCGKIVFDEIEEADDEIEEADDEIEEADDEIEEADDANTHKMAMCLPSVNAVTASSAGSGAVKRRKQTELEKAQSTPTITSVACFFKYLLYILGILIGIGGDSELGVGVFCIGLILGFVARFLPQGGIKFHLFPNEKKQGTCRVTDNDGCTYFVRITDRRLVFCGIQYGRLLGYYLRLPYIARVLAILLCGVNIYPEIAIFILDRLQRSNIISFEVVADDINDYSVERGGFLGEGDKISLTIGNAEYYFKGSIKPICKWIEEQFRSRGRAIV